MMLQENLRHQPFAMTEVVDYAALEPMTYYSSDHITAMMASAGFERTFYREISPLTGVYVAVFRAI